MLTSIGLDQIHDVEITSKYQLTVSSEGTVRGEGFSAEEFFRKKAKEVEKGINDEKNLSTFKIQNRQVCLKSLEVVRRQSPKTKLLLRECIRSSRCPSRAPNLGKTYFFPCTLSVTRLSFCLLHVRLR
jgi:hypothetical protein